MTSPTNTDIQTSSRTRVTITSANNEIDSDQLESESQSPKQANTHTRSLVQTNTSSMLASSLPPSIYTEVETIGGRVETLEEAVHKLLDELTDSDQMTEIMSRLGEIEENQKRVD